MTANATDWLHKRKKGSDLLGKRLQLSAAVWMGYPGAGGHYSLDLLGGWNIWASILASTLYLEDKLEHHGLKCSFQRLVHAGAFPKGARHNTIDLWRSLRRKGLLTPYLLPCPMGKVVQSQRLWIIPGKKGQLRVLEKTTTSHHSPSQTMSSGQSLSCLPGQ